MCDCEPLHKAKALSWWLELQSIPLLQWIAKSANLNLIENLWKDLGT